MLHFDPREYVSTMPLGRGLKIRTVGAQSLVHPNQCRLYVDRDDLGYTLDPGHRRRCAHACPMFAMLPRPRVQRVAATVSNRCKAVAYEESIQNARD